MSTINVRRVRAVTGHPFNELGVGRLATANDLVPSRTARSWNVRYGT